MKIKQPIAYLYLILAAWLTLAGCTSTTPTTQQVGITLLPTSTSVSRPTVTGAIISLPATHIPSYPLPPEKLRSMVELLQSENCKLPCYLGIVPGITQLEEAKAILESLGATHYGDYIRPTDGATGYAYDLNVGYSLGTDETTEVNSNTVLVYHSVSLITNNGKVQIIEIGVGTTTLKTQSLAEQAIAKFREYWSRYNARGIFLQLGQPDSMYVDATSPDLGENGRRLFIVYETRGALIQLYGTRQENNICPESEANFIYLQISLFDPGSTLSIYSNGQSSQDLGLPIKDVLGITDTQFYNQVISTPSKCFKPK